MKVRILDRGRRQKVNEYKGKSSSAPSAGFEPATPGLGNLLCIRGLRRPKTPTDMGFSRSLGLSRTGPQFSVGRKRVTL